MEKTRCLSLKTFLEKAGTHQGGGGDELGASVHFQVLKGRGRRAAITEAALSILSLLAKGHPY